MQKDEVRKNIKKNIHVTSAHKYFVLLTYS